jgi:hypothetical protein
MADQSIEISSIKVIEDINHAQEIGLADAVYIIQQLSKN